MAVSRLLVALILTTLTLKEISGSQRAQDQAKITPIKVDVYYESLCPDSRDFIRDQLYPTYKKLNEYMKLSFIPYGNAKVVGGSPGKWKFDCQHGPEECRGNIIQACVTEEMNGTMNELEFINCAFNSYSQYRIIEKCTEDKVLRRKIEKCADGKFGNNLHYDMGKKTSALNPQQTFIPWITFNGKGSREITDKAIEDLLGLTCSLYKGEKPSACSKGRKVFLNTSYHKDAYL